MQTDLTCRLFPCVCRERPTKNNDGFKPKPKKATLTMKQSATKKTAITKPKRTKKNGDVQPKAEASKIPGASVDNDGPAPARRQAIQPYDDEAYRFMMNQSIPGAHCPIFYIGQKVSKEIAEILGRPMTLAEAMYLVQPDGPVVKCDSEGIPFQPVKYVPFTPETIASALAAGKKLTTTNLYWGGAFYVNKKNEPIALSGAVYHFNDDHRRYEYFNPSPLVKMASELEKRHGRKIWGKPWEDIQRVIRSRAGNIEREKRIVSIADNVYVPERRFTHVSDALANVKHDRRVNGGKGRNEPYKRNRQAEIEPAE